MVAYMELTGRKTPEYRQQIQRLIPPLDRYFLKDFYEKQSAELEKVRKKSTAGNRAR